MLRFPPWDRMAASISKLPKDHILRLIDEEVKQYRAESLENYLQVGEGPHVHPSNNAHELHNALGKWIGWSEYIVEEWASPGKALTVRLTRHAKVQILHMGRWKSITEFLTLGNQLGAPHEKFHGSLWQWWRLNGKHFPLLDLPRELRDQIYAFSHGPQNHPFPSSKLRRPGQYPWPFQSPLPGFNLIRTKKQVARESLEVLYLQVPFLLQHIGLFSRLLLSPRSPLERIRRLELALSHRQFFRLFGLATSASSDGSSDRFMPGYAASRRVRALRRMELTSLTLRVARPSWSTENDDFDGACQLEVVKWLQESALPWVRGHPVTVTGYIKDAQKVPFEEACRAEQKRFGLWRKQKDAVDGTVGNLVEYDEWADMVDGEVDGGVRVDGGDVLAMESKQGRDERGPRVLPPRCYCVAPCKLKTSSAKQ
ncbi:hypothetical protein LTR62_002776 [Meristemomyces frigidus]|uniref:Uncharacterized protein n=1 Tax=Meristemomyces frigidus TaxID=1508187 RepID=A0AAN7TF59_9PEZI|nr:hypothetical protein LTR62_002776 [Meristemomyces frigidus]